MGLQREQFESIMREYERRRLRNHDVELARQSEVYSKVPEFKSLSDSISRISLEHAKNLLNGDKNALASLKSETAALVRRKAELLAEAGFPPDYLEPIYDCRDCKDTGYIGNQKCHCLRQAVIAQLYKQSNIRDILESENFGRFSADLYSDNFVDARTGRSARQVIEEALKSARHFIDTFGSEYNNLFLYGAVGVGKTFLSNCVTREIIDRGYSVMYFSAATFFNAIADGAFKRNDADAQYVYEQIFKCDLLVLDDLGTEYDNSFVSSQLFYCLNERILGKKSMIISTNLTLDGLKERYTERCFSRITSNYTMIKLIGDDLRLKKKLLRM